jgi:hypothetical protein
MKGENAKNIVFGRGIFKLDDVAVGLTRDGGSFKVEYNNRLITADGDRGPVKGRIHREEAKASISFSHLEILTSFKDLHSGLAETVDGEFTTIRGTGKITDADYHKVTFVGETKDGREVEIMIDDAINLENIDFTLKDKDDILDNVVFQATYDPMNETLDEFDERWAIKYKTA